MATLQLDAFIAESLPIVEENLRRYLTFETSDTRRTLEDAMLYAVMAKAKRLRPLLTLASFSLFDADAQKIISLACAMEMLHTYSLIHDDLPSMDNDDFRRGQPTCHKKYGEAVAILAGDTLNTYVFELVARELPKHFPADRVVRSIEKMAYAFGIFGMSGGQMMDLGGSSRQSDQDYLEATHLRKTAAMIEACISLPALLCGAETKAQFHLSQFGFHLGLLFQIVDDILDTQGDPKKMGKSLNKDRDQNKLTYVSLLGIEKARDAAAEEAELAQRSLDAVERIDTGILKEFIFFVHRRDR